SYLVRRMVCGEQTRGYGKVALDLAAALQSSASDEDRCGAMLDVLQSGGWPDDERFLHSWTKSRFYGWFRRARVLTLLQAIEIALQKSAHKSEKLSVEVDGLTIEHIMPQSWQTHWLPGEGSDRAARDALVQNIGNLTLVNDRLNPALSNAAWTGGPTSKRDQLREHSKLELNRKLLAQAGDEWTDAKIDERARLLFDVAREIWPSREAMSAALT
ncbi:MAG TPA: HNH endonuclease family protein, partial [Allosphingosinicella sp.]